MLAIASRLNAKLGKDTVILGSEAITYDRIPSGSLQVDAILGGGWPTNAWHEIVGQYSSGKTGLAYATIARNQELNPDFEAAWIAAEEFSPDYAAKWGVDLSRVVVISTNVMEEAYQALVDIVSASAVDLAVLDSYPALTPTLEEGKDVGESSMGRGALVTGQFFRKVRKAAHRSLTEKERAFTGLFINQYRQKIGVMYGDPRTTPGGQAKDYAFTTRVDVARDEWIETGTGKLQRKIGQKVRVTTLKNKAAPQQQKAFYDLYFDEGGPVPPVSIDRGKEVVELGTALGIVEKSGSWLFYGGQKWQGADNAAAGIREDVELTEALEREVMRKFTGSLSG